MADDISRQEEQRGTRNLLLPISIVAGCGFAAALVVAGVLAFNMKGGNDKSPPPMAQQAAPTVPDPTTGQGSR